LADSEEKQSAYVENTRDARFVGRRSDDMIRDIDPKACPRRPDLSEMTTVHYGLLPRAKPRHFFCDYERPDLAGKLPVGL